MRTLEEIEDYIGICYKYLERSMLSKKYRAYIKGQIHTLYWMLQDSKVSEQQSIDDDKKE